MEPTSDPTSWNLPQPTAQPPLNEHGAGQNSDTTSQAPTYVPGVDASVRAGPNNLRAASTLAKVAPTDSQVSDTLSEKEWVQRVKSVVERTREDPWQQSNEVMQLRKEYLQKHHGKVFGVDG